MDHAAGVALPVDLPGSSGIDHAGLALLTNREKSHAAAAW